MEDSQPEVHEMNLRGGKKIPGPRRDEGKGKMSQPVKGSKVIEPPKDIPLPRSSKDMTYVDCNVLAYLKRIPVSLSVYGDMMLSKKLRETFIQSLLNLEVYDSHLIKK